MKVLFAILGCFVFADGKLLSIDKIEVDIDPVYMKVGPKLIAEGGINRVNLDIEIIKEEAEIVYQAIVYRHNVDHYEHFYKSDMENDCNHEAIKDPVLSFIFKESKKYGNITEMCPLKIGHYSVRSFTIDTSDLPHELPAGDYRFDFTAFVKKSGQLHDIYTDKYYFKA